jgi:hypothetical protein
MLPWPKPGSELRIEPLGVGCGIGAIVVFRRGAKLYYHRVVEQTGPEEWRTKGDTVVHSDEPVMGEEIIGQVTARRRGTQAWTIEPDREAAWLSERLGRWFSGTDRARPRQTGTLGRMVYLVVLLGAWPFRRMLAPRASGLREGEMKRPVK